MGKQYSRLFLMLLVLLGAALFAACHDDDVIGAPTVTPATIEALLLGKVDDIPGFSEALRRTLLHLGGNPQPGVDIVPTATGADFVIGVDKDGDGFYEGDVVGSFTWNDPMVGLAAGGVVQITNLTGNVVQMTTSVTVAGPTQALFDNIVANVPREGDRPQVTVSAGAITVDASTTPPALTGFTDFRVGDVPATMMLADDGSGNQTIVVQGNGFTITVP